jgi:hypothetical protein
MDLLVLDIGYGDVAGGERNSCTNCPVARALTRWLPGGVWEFDGESARNPLYGTFWLRLGLRSGLGDHYYQAIRDYDNGAPLTARRFLLTRGPDQ